MRMLGSGFLPQMHGGSYLLDGISNVVAAYSLRKLRSSYEGAAVRVRRSSDSAEQDIGFNGSGEFDDTAFSSFVGGGTGYVRTWYDQSGSGRNITQVTTTKQPTLYLNAINGKASVLLDGTDDILIFSSPVTVGAAFVVARHAGTTFPAYVGILTGNGGVDSQVGFVGINGTTSFYETGATTFYSLIRVNGGAPSNEFSPLSTYKIVSGTYYDTADTWAKITVGGDREIGGRFWTGNIAEVIILSDTIVNETHNAIGKNLATHYGLTWTTIP